MPTNLIPTPPRDRTTVAPVETRDVTGWPADVMWTVGMYRETGALVRPPEMRPCATPGQETARVTLHAGTEVLPVGPGSSDGRGGWEPMDYLIAGGPVVKYGLIAGAVTTAGYGIYSLIHSVVSWFTVNGAALVSGVVAVGVVTALLLLLGALRGEKGCVGIHCGGCRG